MRATKFSGAAAKLADRHYSRQTLGSDQVLPPGETLILVTPTGNAVWGVCKNLDPVGNRDKWQVITVGPDRDGIALPEREYSYFPA